MGAACNFRVSIITGYGMNMHARGNRVCSVGLCSTEDGWYRVRYVCWRYSVGEDLGPVQGVEDWLRWLRFHIVQWVWWEPKLLQVHKPALVGKFTRFAISFAVG